MANRRGRKRTLDTVMVRALGLVLGALGNKSALAEGRLGLVEGASGQVGGGQLGKDGMLLRSRDRLRVGDTGRSFGEC